MPCALLADLVLVLYATFILFVVLGGFIDHYLVPLIFPIGLNSETQALMGLAVLFINAVI
jgi:hypothetical protein